MTTSAAGYITDVSYIPGFYPQMAPVMLRYVASLNRVAPPATAPRFRYLELGCGLGRSLTALAAAYPQGEFCGVDVNPEHTRFAERDIAAGHLQNARVLTSGFEALPADLGGFDFIALHGVFSWVSEGVRREILAIARERLAPGGLLLVSYNAMPGWAHLQPIRGILRQYALLRAGDSIQKVREALSYLVFIRDRHARYFEDNPKAAAYVDGLLKQDIRYLAHEYVNEHWTSLYFSDVAAMFGEAGLAFVGSLPVFTNFWDLCVRPEFQELFRTTSNRLVTEAHKDFCANTAFRWDIYGKEPRMIADVAGRLAAVDDLHFSVTRPGIKLPHRVDLGIVTTTVQGGLYERLFQLFGDRSLRLSELCAMPELQATGRDEVVRAVDAGVAMGLFDVTAGPLNPKPAAGWGAVSVPCAFNRAILASDGLGGGPLALASGIMGSAFTFGDLDGAVVQELADHGKDGLVERIDARLTASGRSLMRDGAAVTDQAARIRLLGETCAGILDNTVPQLARLGIVTVTDPLPKA